MLSPSASSAVRPRLNLRPDQTDQDSLPPYEVLDGIIEAYMEHDLSLREILGMNYAEADVRRVVHLVRLSEHKRRQSPARPSHHSARFR